MKWEAAPESLPALPVGAHGLVVIDADRKAGGADDVAAFHALCVEQGIDLSAAFVVDTIGWISLLLHHASALR